MGVVDRVNFINVLPRPPGSRTQWKFPPPQPLRARSEKQIWTDHTAYIQLDGRDPSREIVVSTRPHFRAF